MSTFRQALYGLALLGALVLLIWVQETRITDRYLMQFAAAVNA